MAQKFELYVKKNSGKLIPFRSTPTLAPLDGDGDRTYIRVTALPNASHHKNLKYGTSVQTAYDFGTGSTYAGCDIVSNIDWKQVKMSSKMGPYIEYANGWKLLKVHVTSLVHSGKTIKAGDALCRLADLATIQASLAGTGIKVTAPHDHVAVWLNGVSQPINNWFLNGTKTHVSQLKQTTLPPVVTPPPVTDPCQIYKDRIKVLEVENIRLNQQIAEIRQIIG